MKKKFFTGLLFLTSTLVLQAQNPEANDINYWTDSVITPQFFIAVIAGVLLAMGFQFILTALSVALGITAVGDLKESYVKGKYHPNRKDNLHDFDNDVTDNDDDDDDGMDTGTMITTGFGIWSVITVGLSLFGATALAINLALISSTIISITLGLVIWATFFILVFYLESKVVNSVIGGLINTATSGLRASGEAVKSMFTPSKETQLKNVAEDTVDKIRKDFSASFDPHVINDAIDEFFTRVDKTVPDYEKVKNDIRKIVEESDERSEKIQEQHDNRQEKIQEKSDKRQEKIADKKGGGGSPAKWMAINNVLSNAISEGSDNGDSQGQGKVEQLKRLQKELKAAYDEGNTNEERVEKAVAKLTSAEEEQVHGYIEKIKGVLSSATPNDMDSSQVQDKIMQVVKNPTVEGPKLAGKLGDLDRKTIIDVLSKNTALDRKQLEKYADQIEQVINKIKSTLGGGISTGDTDFSDLKLKLEKQIYKFMNGSGGGSGVDFSSLTGFFQSKMDNQKDSLKSIKRNLSNMDRESIVAVVTNNTSIDRNDIDKVVQSYEDAKNNVLKKVNDIENEANRRVENLKRKAIIHAENTRKNAAAAAWWVVISAVLSAGAAIGGSLLALA